MASAPAAVLLIAGRAAGAADAGVGSRWRVLRCDRRQHRSALPPTGAAGACRPGRFLRSPAATGGSVPRWTVFRSGKLKSGLCGWQFLLIWGACTCACSLRVRAAALGRWDRTPLARTGVSRCRWPNRTHRRPPRRPVLAPCTNRGQVPLPRSPCRPPSLPSGWVDWPGSRMGSTPDGAVLAGHRGLGAGDVPRPARLPAPGRAADGAAGILHATRSFGATDQALAGLLATACMAATAGAWARARHATSGVCQVTLMLAAAACGYLGVLGVFFPDARMQDSTSVLAVGLPIGMSWLMLHRMDWSRPASMGVLAAASSLGTIAARSWACCPGRHSWPGSRRARSR